jgi:flagellar motor switch protein FliG
MGDTAIAPVLSGVQKAAILLVALGDEVSSTLLKQLSDEEVALVTGVIANLPIIPLQQAESILEEFHYAANSALQMGRGGTEYARRILTHAFGPDRPKPFTIAALPGRSGYGRNAPTSCRSQINPQLGRASLPSI